MPYGALREPRRHPSTYLSTDPSFDLPMVVFSLLGSKIVPCGGPALGLTAKCANDYISSTIKLAKAEFFDFAMKSGMDPRVLQSSFKTTKACNKDERNNPVPGISPEAPSLTEYKNEFKVEYAKRESTVDQGGDYDLVVTKGVVVVFCDTAKIYSTTPKLIYF